MHKRVVLHVYTSKRQKDKRTKGQKKQKDKRVKGSKDKRKKGQKGKSFSLFDPYLVVFGLFLPKTEEQNYHTQKILFNVKIWIRVGGEVFWQYE